MRRKLGLFGHVCRMKNNIKIKDVMTWMMEGTGRRGRRCREWMNAITDWCQTYVHILSLQAQDRDTWKMIMKMHWTPMGSVPMDRDDENYD